MFAQHQATAAAFLRRQCGTLFRRSIHAAALLCALLAVAGCTAPLQPTAALDPSNPEIRVPTTGYRSTLGPFTSQRPVDPADWKGTNQRITPQPKSGQ